MRLIYTLVALILSALFVGELQSISPDMQLLSFSIILAGALAGGDGK